VGAPEGTEFVEGLKRINVTYAVSMRLEQRTLHVNAPACSKLELFSMNGKLVMRAEVGTMGAVSLNRLPLGNYIARVKGLNGAVLAKKSIVLR
jgi:hypothetical protein